jgi:phosphoribosylglycinamide formyltransferase-1
VSLKKIVILFSGEGSNLENLIIKLHPDIVKVAAAITNNPNAKGVEKAEKLGIKTIIIDHKKYNTREDFDKELVKTIQNINPDLTVLAGFMRILTPLFTDNIRAINIHPSLLPLFKGANALQRSFESDMKVAGVTVHEVITELDAGKIILQQCFSKNDMDFETFKENIHACEYEIYPQAVLNYMNLPSL